MTILGLSVRQPPHLGLSSAKHRTGFVRMSTMELFNEYRGTLHELSWLPSARRYGIVFPVDMVLEFASGNFRIKNGCNLKLFFSRDDQRGKGLGRSAWYCVLAETLEEVDVKNRVDPHGCWEVQTIGTSPDLLEYLKRANSFVIKLLGWSFGAEISGV